MEKRQGQLLINKLENVLPLLIKLIKGAEFKNLKEKFPMPLKDLITGLYVPNFENQFYLGYVIKPGVKKGNMRGRASIIVNSSDNPIKRKSSVLINTNDANKIKETNVIKLDTKPNENQEKIMKLMELNNLKN